MPAWEQGSVIPFIELAEQNRALRSEIEGALARVLDGGVYALGPEVAAFEEEFAAFCGVPHAVAVSTGTSALQLALQAAGVGPGDRVVTTPFTFIATAASVCSLGATPVFADIDAATFNLDPAAAEAAAPGARALLPVHLYGQPADMASLRALAARQGLALVEDAAQAHGAEFQGARAGSMGDLGCFSFYPTKNLGALGEAGLVTTADPEFAARVRQLRSWGESEKYLHAELGTNARLDAFQGAILRVKLRHLERFTEARRRIATLYDKALAEAGIAAPSEAPGRRHVYHVYTVRVPERERVRERLLAAGVGTGIVYPIPLHLQPALAHLGHRPGEFPEAERAAREVLALPMYPELPEDVPERVAAALVQALG